MNHIDSIPFRQHMIRVSRTPQGDIGKVCVNDLCTALNRSLLVHDGTALRKCPSLEILDAEHPRNLYASLDESVRFVQWMARGSKLLRERSLELLQTLQKARNISALESSGVGRAADAVPQNTFVLEYADHGFTVRLDNERYMVNATEMARPFGKRPAVWLKLVETIRLRQTLVGNGTLPDQQSQIITSRVPPERRGSKFIFACSSQNGSRRPSVHGAVKNSHPCSETEIFLSMGSSGHPIRNRP